MDKTNLVQVKGGQDITFQTDVLKPFTNYRCIVAEENGIKQYYIYGIVFDEKNFNKYFEFTYDIVMRNWIKIGLLPESKKPITKKLFKEMGDIHKYGKARRALKVIYFMNSRECAYGFYPMQGSNVNVLKECYQMYIDTINGNMIHVNDRDIRFGNCGLPLNYSGLRAVKPYIKENV